MRKVLFIVTTPDEKTIYNAIRLANMGMKKGADIRVFMLGQGVLFDQSSSDQFNVMDQVNQFEGDFYV